MAGLDPAIYLFEKTMDARVKPAHDSCYRCSRSPNRKMLAV
jgi:hypothetical protein